MKSHFRMLSLAWATKTDVRHNIHPGGASYMSGKVTIALAVAALVGFAMTPVDAFARGGHGGYGGHSMHVGHIGHVGHFHGFRGARFAFYPGFYGYGAYPYYYDDGCYLRRRVVGTPWGPRVRLVRVCYY